MFEPGSKHDTMGRSPRARRSHAVALQGLRSRGSISASAEEPSNPAWHALQTRVDLRERGGARTPRLTNPTIVGRSPRARRSQRSDREALLRAGSISASAEEPWCWRPRRSRAWVDLRERGGASPRSSGSSRAWGRSPRARRSLHRNRARRVCDGSISASAEEPSAISLIASNTRVDLRERGGASLTLLRSPRKRPCHECRSSSKEHVEPARLMTHRRTPQRARSRHPASRRGNAMPAIRPCRPPVVDDAGPRQITPGRGAPQRRRCHRPGVPDGRGMSENGAPPP